MVKTFGMWIYHNRYTVNHIYELSSHEVICSLFESKYIKPLFNFNQQHIVYHFW